MRNMLISVSYLEFTSLTAMLVDWLGAALTGVPWSLLSKSLVVVASKGPSSEPSTKLVTFVWQYKQECKYKQFQRGKNSKTDKQLKLLLITTGHIQAFATIDRKLNR